MIARASFEGWEASRAVGINHARATLIRSWRGPVLAGRDHTARVETAGGVWLFRPWACVDLRVCEVHVCDAGGVCAEDIVFIVRELKHARCACLWGLS